MKKTISLFKTLMLSLFTICFVMANLATVAKAAETDTTAVADTGLSTAVIEVESYTIEGGLLEAGKDITVNLTLHNLSSKAGATNVMITTSSASGMIYPVYGKDNQVFVGTIPAGGTQVVEIPLSISPKFNADYVDFTCKFDYQTGGTKASNTSTMMIPTSGGSTVNVKSVSLSSRASVNAKTLLSISYSNNSDTNISDARLLIDGKVSTDSQFIKLGTIRAGKNYSEDLHVTFTEEGSQEISIKLAYTDVTGETVEIDLGNHVVSVGEELATTKNGYGYNRTLALVGKLVAAVALLIAAVCTLFYFKKK